MVAARHPDAAPRPSLASRALVLALPLLMSVALLVGCATPGPRAPARLALVIGNGAYEGMPPLANPGNDARAMCEALKTLGFKTLCHTDVRTRDELDARVREYAAQLGPQTAGVVFYSGHGLQAGQANYLVPTRLPAQAAVADPLRALYPLDQLFDRLRDRPARFQLVILDACRTDPFAPPPAAAGSTRSAAAGATRSAVVRTLEVAARASYGLAPIQDAPPDTVVLYATASREAAYDGLGAHGPLTKHVLGNIASPGLPVMDFIGKVVEGVGNETSRQYTRRQVPHYYGSFSGRFCFAGCPGDIIVPPVN